MGVVKALEALRLPNLQITIFTDSQYLVNSVEKGWLNKWMATGFAGGKKNKDLWLRYHQLAKPHTIKFVWVKGHANNPHNNRCDKLATDAADGKQLAIDEGFEAEQGAGKLL